MKAIFSNNAISTLAAPVAIGDSQIFINDLSNFPTPVVGEEYYMATLVGGCDDRVEIVRVVETCETYINVDLRGAEETTEQVFVVGDGAFHGITAKMMETIINMWEWYLGPFTDPPIVDNNGYDLLQGHLYYDVVEPGVDPVTAMSVMKVWDGTAWRPFDSIVGGSQVTGYTWELASDLASGSPLPWPDSYGLAPIDFIDGSHVIDLYINGAKVLPDKSPVIDGDYYVDYDADDIHILQDLVVGDIIEAKVMIDVGEIKDGVDGEDGEDGENGAIGLPGFNPYISDGSDGFVPGNWIISTGDSGVSSISQNSGFKNVLVNPRFDHDERGFVTNHGGNWAALVPGVYGYERWMRFIGSSIGLVTDGKQQYIEHENLVDGVEYTLSWEGGGNGQMNLDSLKIIEGISPLTAVYNKEAPFPNITVPFGASFPQLEIGKIRTGFEVRNFQIEEGMCMRHFYRRRIYNFIISVYTPNGDTRSESVPHPVPMRATPNLKYNTWTGTGILAIGINKEYVNAPTNSYIIVADQDVYKMSHNGVPTGYTDSVVIGTVRVDNGNKPVEFDAEIYP